MKSNIAFLSNKENFSYFTFNDCTLKFKTSKNLLHYTKINKWDNGYLEVMTKTKQGKEVEDYIDLIPICENLYMNAERFCKDIKRVEIFYE